MSRIEASPLLRGALAADAISSGATAALALAGAKILEPLLGLPGVLLQIAGLSLVPFVMFVGWLAARPTASAGLVLLAIGLNVLWTIDSLILLIGGWFQPTWFGTAFVLTQAVAVAAFAALQWVGLKRSRGLA